MENNRTLVNDEFKVLIKKLEISQLRELLRYAVCVGDTQAILVIKDEIDEKTRREEILNMSPSDFLLKKAFEQRSFELALIAVTVMDDKPLKEGTEGKKFEEIIKWLDVEQLRKLFQWALPMAARAEEDKHYFKELLNELDKRDAKNIPGKVKYLLR